MAQTIIKTKEQLKRKYNAAYRLRKKIKGVLPKRSHVIYSNDEGLHKAPEVVILIKEYGFIIQPSLFE